MARASAAAKLTAEVHAQARQNGRVLDDFVFRIGGSETLKVEADLDKFIPRPEFKGWKVFFETWPHDILLRTNMATSVWQDMPAMVAFRDAIYFEVRILSYLFLKSLETSLYNLNPNTLIIVETCIYSFKDIFVHFTSSTHCTIGCTSRTKECCTERSF